MKRWTAVAVSGDAGVGLQAGARLPRVCWQRLLLLLLLRMLQCVLLLVRVLKLKLGLRGRGVAV